MHKYAVTTTQEIEADTVEEAALLMYQALARGPAPLRYSVIDDRGQKIDFDLDRERAAEFANLDHTADPGNW
jgi:hypothetical protein